MITDFGRLVRVRPISGGGAEAWPTQRQPRLPGDVGCRSRRRPEPGGSPRGGCTVAADPINGARTRNGSPNTPGAHGALVLDYSGATLPITVRPEKPKLRSMVHFYCTIRRGDGDQAFHPSHACDTWPGSPCRPPLTQGKPMFLAQSNCDLNYFNLRGTAPQTAAAYPCLLLLTNAYRLPP